MNNPFKIERITWHEVADKVKVDPLHEALNTYIDLSKYGSGVRSIAFTYIAVKPSNKRHENSARYNRKTGQIDISLGLSYVHVVEAKPERVLQMMASLFLVSIDLYEQLKIQDFNNDAFKKDLEHLFDSKGWLSVAQNT